MVERISRTPLYYNADRSPSDDTKANFRDAPESRDASEDIPDPTWHKDKVRPAASRELADTKETKDGRSKNIKLHTVRDPPLHGGVRRTNGAALKASEEIVCNLAKSDKEEKKNVEKKKKPSETIGGELTVTTLETDIPKVTAKSAGEEPHNEDSPNEKKLSAATHVDEKKGPRHTLDSHHRTRLFDNLHHNKKTVEPEVAHTSHRDDTLHGSACVPRDKGRPLDTTTDDL